MEKMLVLSFTGIIFQWLCVVLLIFFMYNLYIYIMWQLIAAFVSILIDFVLHICTKVHTLFGHVR